VKQFDIKDIVEITPDRIVFDVRAVLKCRWGCTYAKYKSVRCEAHGISIEERRQMVQAYHRILFLHGHDKVAMSRASLELEKELFEEGYYFAFALRHCSYCDDCAVAGGKACIHPDKVRPCESLFGIDVFRTARNLGFPIAVLKTKEEPQNRFGFVLVE
jgi:predicted metal-binding protein